MKQELRRAFSKMGLVCGLLFLDAGNAALATDHYIKPDATGNGSGTDWVNAMTAPPSTWIRGDVYYLADGNYPGQVFSTPASGSLPITLRKATPFDHGIETGWVDTLGDGQAVFNGMLEFTSPYWSIDGVTGGGAAHQWHQNFGIRIVEKRDAYALIRINYSGNSHDIRLSHLDLEGKGSVSDQGGYYSNDGIALYNNAENITLSYAWLHETGRCPVFITSAQNVLFEHLYVSSFYGSPAVHSEVMSAGQGPLGDITWRYSLITALKSTGGLMFNNIAQPTSHLYVYGNVFYQPPGVIWDMGNGVIGGWTSTSNAMNNVWVYNNTFINVAQQSLTVLPLLYSGNRAYNNLFVNSQSPDFSRFTEHDYNQFVNAGSTHAELHGTVGSNPDLFIDVNGLNFRLKAATDPGKPLEAPYNRDGWATVRGGDGLWDRGAHEWDAPAVLEPPGNLRVM
jgi:hypothetical protein